MKVENYFDKINLIVWGVVCFMTIAFPIYFFFMVLDYTKNRNERFKEKYMAFWDGMRKESKLSMTHIF